MLVNTFLSIYISEIVFKDYSKRSWMRLWCNSSKTSSGSPASLIHIHVLLYSLLHMHRHSRSQSAEGAGRIQIRMEPLLIDVLSDHAAASDTIGPDRLISRQQWGRWSQSGVYKVKKTHTGCLWMTSMVEIKMEALVQEGSLRLSDAAGGVF